MKPSKKFLVYLLVVIAIILLAYFVLGVLGLVPTWQCGSTMGPNGSVDWCQWHTGIIVG